MVEAFVVLEAGERTAGADADRVVPWWSFSKTVIAATALRLSDQGRLDLDRPAEASLLSLLRHEARARDYGGLPAYHHAVAAGEPPWTPQELQARVSADPRLRVTADWSYSNIGYLRARELTEAAGAAGLGDLARALLFEPLGLAGPRLASTTDDLADVAMGAATGYHPGWVYHGLFVGPLADAAATLEGILDPAAGLLSEAARRRLLDCRDLPHHTRAPWSGAGYGTGVMLPTLADGAPVAGHTGGGPGGTIAVYHRLTGRPRTAAAFAFSDRESAVESAVAERLSRTP